MPWTKQARRLEGENGPSLWPTDRHKPGRCAADCMQSQLFNQCYFPLTRNNIQVSGPGNTNPSPRRTRREEFLDVIQKVYPLYAPRMHPPQFARAWLADPPKHSNRKWDRHRWGCRSGKSWVLSQDAFIFLLVLFLWVSWCLRLLSRGFTDGYLLYTCWTVVTMRCTSS